VSELYIISSSKNKWNFLKLSSDVEGLEVVPAGRLKALPSHTVTKAQAHICLYLLMFSLTTLAVTQVMTHSSQQKRQHL